MELGVNVQTLQQSSGIGFGRVAAVVADDPLKLAEAHAVLVGPIRCIFVEPFAFLQRLPQRGVPHDHGVDDAVVIERELILAEDADFLGARNRTLGWLQFAGQDFHERRLTGAIGAGNRVASSLLESGVHFFKQNAGAEAHGEVVDRDQG